MDIYKNSRLTSIRSLYQKTKSGFTIVELIVVIVIIGILASISIVSYGNWQKSVIQTQLKNDLSGVATAMESYRTFNNTYPTSIPTTFTPSQDVFLVISSNGKLYCIDATSSKDVTLHYYIDQSIGNQGAKEGACSGRPILPSVPDGFIATVASAVQINLSWNPNINATSYDIQCATDNLFISLVKQLTQASNSVQLDGLIINSTYYCRIRATNSTGSSAWTVTSTSTTTNNYGSLPVATSIDGYWTSVPTGFFLEDGSAVSRTTYADLFAAIGTTYGAGDGSTTFNLPDSRGRVSVNKSADTEFDTMGEKPGSKTEALTIAQMPSHTHVQNSHTHTITDPGHNHTQNAHTHEERSSQNGDGIGIEWGGQGGWGISSGTNNAIFQMILTYYGASNNTATTGLTVGTVTATNQDTGGNQTHNNLQPSITKLSAIKYTVADMVASSLVAASSIDGYWTVAPADYLLEDGSAVSRTTYVDLFAVIGTTYGSGDGSTTFNLPDSRGRVSVNKSADTEFDTMGEKTGTKTETITTAQLPVHTHIQNTHVNQFLTPTHNHTQNPHDHYAANSPNGDAIGLPGGGGSGWGLGSGTNNNIYRLVSTSTTATNNAAYTGVSVNSATAVNQSIGGGQSHNNIQPSIVKMSAIKYTPAIVASTPPAATATSVEGYWTTVPTGYLAENGSAVSRTTYVDLFAVIGTTYGSGDGSTTFNLPDSRGRVAVNKSTTDTEFDTMGEKPGSKTEALTIAQMPTHTHIQNSHTHTVTDPGHNHTQVQHNHEGKSSQNGDYIGMEGSTGGGWGLQHVPANDNNIYRMLFSAVAATNNASTTGVTANSTVAVNQSNGSGLAHNNIQPSIVKMFAIKY